MSSVFNIDSSFWYLWGTSWPTNIQSASQAYPKPPTTFSRAPGPALAAMLGSTNIPAADPRYMPEVLKDTAFALSCGGIHCREHNAFIFVVALLFSLLGCLSCHARLAATDPGACMSC